MAIAIEIRTAMNPKSYGQLTILMANSLRGCPNVQVQAVFALYGLFFPIEFIAIECADGIAWLPTDIAESVCFFHAFPFHDGLWTFPTKFSNGWRCIRDASEYGYFTRGRGYALHLSSLDFDNGTLSPYENGHHTC